MLDVEYGLEFRKDTTASPIQQLSAVVTRSKAKAMLHHSISSSPEMKNPSS